MAGSELVDVSHTQTEYRQQAQLETAQPLVPYGRQLQQRLLKLTVKVQATKQAVEMVISFSVFNHLGFPDAYM